MKRTITALGLLALVLLTTAVSCSDVSQGSPCSEIGATHKNESGETFRCVRNDQNGKGFWVSNFTPFPK